MLLCLTHQTVSADMTKPLVVGQPVRLAITPLLDGKLAEEEWDKLAEADGFESYFQWEPETVYWAAKAKAGEDVVLTLDTNADGWLIGNDNLEFRVSNSNGSPSLSVRRLDATDPNGPKWTTSLVISESVRMATSQFEGGWILEASFTPPGTESPAAGRRYGLRIDPVATGSEVGEPYVPRSLSFVNLQFDLGQDLPTGFSWKPDFLVRSVPVDDSFKVKYGFKRTEDLSFSQVEYRAEGYAKSLMATGTKPFPQWDKKGKSSEEYATIIAKDAEVGYRVLRLTLLGGDGKATVLRSSFKIADLIDYEVNLPKILPMDPEARIVRGSITLRSNGLQRVKGDFKLTVPEPWTATRGKETQFVIYRSRGLAKIPIELIVPKDTVGVFPVTMTSTIGDRVVKKTVYIPVGQL